MTNGAAPPEAKPGPKPDQSLNPRRACFKMAIILGLIVFSIAALGLRLNDQTFDHLIDQIKFELSLGSLIFLIVIINLISLLLFALLFFAYQWVRCDLKKPRVEDERDLVE